MTGSLNANSYDSVPLNKGTPAPYAGVLFTEDSAQLLRTDLLEADKVKIQYETELHRTERLMKIGKMKDDEIELYATQNKRLLKAHESSDRMNMLWFGLGIVVTGLAVYGAGSLSR